MKAPQHTNTQKGCCNKRAPMQNTISDDYFFACLTLSIDHFIFHFDFLNVRTIVVGVKHAYISLGKKNYYQSVMFVSRANVNLKCLSYVWWW